MTVNIIMKNLVTITFCQTQNELLWFSWKMLKEVFSADYKILESELIVMLREILVQSITGCNLQPTQTPAFQSLKMRSKGTELDFMCVLSHDDDPIQCLFEDLMTKKKWIYSFLHLHSSLLVTLNPDLFRLFSLLDLVVQFVLYDSII